MAKNLSRFIDHARQNEVDHATIFLLLRSLGWKEKEIANAFATHELATPIPDRLRIGSVRDAFLHLLIFSALHASILSLKYSFRIA